MPNFDNLRKQAKLLVRWHRAGNYSVGGRIRGLPRYRNLTDVEALSLKFPLSEAQEIIATVPDLHPIIPVARSHHERWDGKGYPDRLGGDDIHPWARIVAVADAFDAMTSDRPYRKGLPVYVAFSEMTKQSGRQFEPRAVEGFLAIRDRIQQESKNNAGTQITRRSE